MGNNVPNFDLMTTAELRAWYEAHRSLTRSLAASIFPGRPDGYVRAAIRLRNYAINLHVARKLRDEGDHTVAEQYERICVNIKNDLPAYARW